MIFRFIIFFFLFYIVFRAIKAILKYLTISKSNPNIHNFKNNPSGNFSEKHKVDIEDAEFTEIETDHKSHNN